MLERGLRRRDEPFGRPDRTLRRWRYARLLVLAERSQYVPLAEVVPERKVGLLVAAVQIVGDGLQVAGDEIPDAAWRAEDVASGKRRFPSNPMPGLVDVARQAGDVVDETAQEAVMRCGRRDERAAARHLAGHAAEARRLADHAATRRRRLAGHRTEARRLAGHAGRHQSLLLSLATLPTLLQGDRQCLALRLDDRTF